MPLEFIPPLPPANEVDRLIVRLRSRGNNPRDKIASQLLAFGRSIEDVKKLMTEEGADLEKELEDAIRASMHEARQAQEC